MAAPDARRPETPDEALEALVKGNERYASDKAQLKDYSHLGEEIASRQTPFAAILSCADSRVSATLVFDVASGNIFVVRVAGNVAGALAAGSLEFAVEVLGVPLVVVLGHSDCGAVKAGLSAVTNGERFPRSKYGEISAFVDEIVPAIDKLPETARTWSSDRGECTLPGCRAGQREPIFAERVEAGRLKVVAATYDIASGKVTFLA